MQPRTKQLYTNYTTLLQKAADINYASAVLGWDQEIYMPVKGAEYRSRQLATLASQAHELLTSDSYGTLLASLSSADGLTVREQCNVAKSLEDYAKAKMLPSAFVEELSKQTSLTFNAWVEARKMNDFSLFAGPLTNMIALKKQQAALYGYVEQPYDALLDDYEKGATVKMLDQVFAGIKEELPPILGKIKSAQQVGNDCFKQHFPKQQQWNFSIEVLTAMGFDFEAGRQDYSEHPFTTSFAPTDVRITTRVDEGNFASMLWSCIHEGGHGLYEQGLPEDQYGLPLGAATSLGIHESQSRLWENNVGRSAGFWSFFYPRLQKRFPGPLANVTAQDFIKAANKVEPSLIRTEADEVTYHFHVLIRYEIEKELITGQLSTSDLPARWNDLYAYYLGVRPKDDKTGVLQDVHWSHGMFGYFPTYTLGSFYAAQFFQQMQKDIPDLDNKIATGDLYPLLEWLRSSVHQYGRQYNSEELCKRITGQGLDPRFFIAYAKQKYGQVYGISEW